MAAPENPVSVDRASACLTAGPFVSPMRYATFNGAQPETTDESSRSGGLSRSRRRRGTPGSLMQRISLPRSWHATGTPSPSTSRKPTELHHRFERQLPHRRRRFHLQRSQAGRDESHPRVSHAEAGARRAWELKFQICLFRSSRSASSRRALSVRS